MEAQPSLIGADGGVELHPEGAVDLHIAGVVHPGHPELDDPLRLHQALENARLLEVGALFYHRLEGFQHLAHGLEELRLVGVFLCRCVVYALQIFILEFHFPKPLYFDGETRLI